MYMFEITESQKHAENGNGFLLLLTKCNSFRSTFWLLVAVGLGRKTVLIICLNNVKSYGFNSLITLHDVYSED
jgi:hypothetical protein